MVTNRKHWIDKYKNSTNKPPCFKLHDPSYLLCITVCPIAKECKEQQNNEKIGDSE